MDWQEIARNLMEGIASVLSYAQKGLRLLFSKPKKKVIKVVSFKPTHPSEVASVPEAYKKQIGTLKAEIAILKEKIEKLKKEKELLKKKRRLELLNLIESRRDMIAKLKYGEYLKLSFPTIKKPIAVLSRDFKQLGWFYTFLVGNGEIALVVSEYPDGKGRKFIVMRGPDWDSIFDFSENIADQIKSGIMVVNRLYDGKFIPPIKIPFAKLPVIALKEGFACAYCYKRFDSERELIKHLKEKHLKLLIQDGMIKEVKP